MINSRMSILPALLLAAIVFLPMALPALWIKVVTSAAIFALAAAGVGVLFAQLGLTNLAQVSLVGLGGWISLRLGYGTALPFEIILVVAGALTALVGGLLALPALRMRGLYLALVTLMCAGAFQIVINAVQFPNGGEGFWGVARQSITARRPAVAQSDAGFLRYTLIVVAMGLALVTLHRVTAPGRAWAMIRQSEANAMAAGVNVTAFKLWAFSLSGFLAGVAGALLGSSVGQLDARSFLASESILLFALAIVGGLYSWVGAVLAGALFKLVPALFNNWGISADLSLVVFGAALIHAVSTAPRGMAGQLESAFATVFRR